MSTIINKPLKSSAFFVSKSGITIIGEVKEYDTIAKRDADPIKPKYAIVKDATGDPTVNSGSATYSHFDNTWTKVYESEIMDPDNPWDDESVLKEPNGFSQLPNGIMFQWGTTNDIIITPGDTTEISIVFPTTFPINVFNVSATINGSPDVTASVFSRSATLVTFKIKNNSTDPETIKLTYQAIGH